jgi:hypothetical protein
MTILQSLGKGWRIEPRRGNPTAATAEAMSPGKKSMPCLWEREVGRLPPKHFANAVLASQVLTSFLPPPPSYHAPSSQGRDSALYYPRNSKNRTKIRLQDWVTSLSDRIFVFVKLGAC